MTETLFPELDWEFVDVAVESVKRSGRRGFEVCGSSKKSVILLNDNGDERNVNEYCMQKKAYICNPIIDWSEDGVWAFIRHNNLPYCKLYDKGFKRLGCIGCPLASVDAQKRGLDRYPNFKKLYIRAFGKMLERLKAEGLRNKWWTDAESVYC